MTAITANTLTTVARIRSNFERHFTPHPNVRCSRERKCSNGALRPASLLRTARGCEVTLRKRRTDSRSFAADRLSLGDYSFRLRLGVTMGLVRYRCDSPGSRF